MRFGSRLNTEACCYGFIHERPIRGALWSRAVQRPFRGSALWIFGDSDAALKSLKLGGKEQLADPTNALTLAMFDRRVEPELVLQHVQLELNTSEHSRLSEESGTTLQVFGARCLKALNMAPHLMLPSIGVGAEIAFVCTGNVRGVLLVGGQVV